MEMLQLDKQSNKIKDEIEPTFEVDKIIIGMNEWMDELMMQWNKLGQVTV